MLLFYLTTFDAQWQMAAEEMEQSGIKGRVCISDATHLATEGAFDVELLSDPLPQLHNKKTIRRYLVVASLACEVCSAL